MMQFGHNDNGPLDDKDRARGTIKGVGEETREIDNPSPNSTKSSTLTAAYLPQVHQRNPRRRSHPHRLHAHPPQDLEEGKIAREQYADWARQVAADSKVPVVDLNELVAKKYEAMGPKSSSHVRRSPHPTPAAPVPN
jgi:hypothetical protein